MNSFGPKRVACGVHDLHLRSSMGFKISTPLVLASLAFGYFSLTLWSIRKLYVDFLYGLRY
jgi:hypothetical protein